MLLKALCDVVAERQKTRKTTANFAERFFRKIPKIYGWCALCNGEARQNTI